MLSYFEVPENLEEISPHVAALWKRYLEEDDKFRNDRLKMIARCPTGPWFVRKLIGNVPTIIGHKLPQYTYRGEGYCEQMIDCLLYTSPSPRDRSLSRMPSSA